MTDIEHLKDLMHGIQYAMLTTTNSDDGSLRSRPMTLQQTDFDGYLWLFTCRNAALVADIEENPRVNLALSNPKDNSYVSITGVAELVLDHKKSKELWTPFLKPWFPDGPDDPNLGLLKIHVESADYWKTASSKVVQLLGFAKAVLSGERYKSEDHSRKHIELNS